MCKKRDETTATFSNGLTSVLLVIVRSKRLFYNLSAVFKKLFFSVHSYCLMQTSLFTT
ncbi:hypothetical protein HMPREF3199_01837 [Enterococcus faecium]|nr:hypothetical protein HMPREF3199_01837 [Enterococcus faecium]